MNGSENWKRIKTATSLSLENNRHNVQASRKVVYLFMKDLVVRIEYP